MLEVIFITLAVALAVAGIIGSILPILPGPPMGYAGILLLHFARGDVFSNAFLITFGFLTAAAVVIDYALPAVGAKMYGASKYGVIGSAIGMIVGLIVFSLPGMFIGMFAGAVAGEYLAGKKTREALKSGTASFAGGVAATALKLVLCVVMLFYVLINLT